MSFSDTEVLSEQQVADLHGQSLSAAEVLLNPELSASSSEAVSDQEGADTAAFTFVGVLAADVSSGEFDLPSWPEVVVQIRRALEDEDCHIERIVRLIGSEPVLAAKILKMANSALISRSEPVSDLRSAVSRLGFEMIRNTAISLAMEQIFQGEAVAAVKPYLAELWLHSTKVAALAYLLAKRVPKINADEAFLAGLIHAIGKLYVLIRAQNDSVLFDCEDALQEIMGAWHTSIGRAIVESWGFSEELAQAVGEHELYDLEGGGPATLTDVVAVANLLAKQPNDEVDNPVELNEVPACRRLALDADSYSDVVLAAEDDVQELRRVLGV